MLVGDSVTDLEAAHAAEIPCIGYASKPHKAAALTAAGADAVITSMTDLAAALAKAPELPN